MTRRRIQAQKSEQAVISLPLAIHVFALVFSLVLKLAKQQLKVTSASAGGVLGADTNKQHGTERTRQQVIAHGSKRFIFLFVCCRATARGALIRHNQKLRVQHNNSETPGRWLPDSSKLGCLVKLKMAFVAQHQYYSFARVATFSQTGVFGGIRTSFLCFCFALGSLATFRSGCSRGRGRTQRKVVVSSGNVIWVLIKLFALANVVGLRVCGSFPTCRRCHCAS